MEIPISKTQCLYSSLISTCASEKYFLNKNSSLLELELSSSR